MMNLTPSTYRAVQVASPGKFEFVERPLLDPPAGKVRLRIEACVICQSKSMSQLIGGLGPRGRMIVAGAGSSPIEVLPFQLLFGSRAIEGTLTGSAIDNEDTLAFSALQNVKPMIETVSLEKAAEGYARTARNEARFRMVIVMDR